MDHRGLLGEKIHSGITYKGIYPPIITPEQFDLIHSAKESRKLDYKNGPKIAFHYLGYYVKWIPQEAYYYAVENTGFKARPYRSQGTYSKYSSIG